MHAYIRSSDLAIAGWLAGWRAQHSLLILRLACACIWPVGLACLASFRGSNFSQGARLLRPPHPWAFLRTEIVVSSRTKRAVTLR
jgi:hypothetical protein